MSTESQTVEAATSEYWLQARQPLVCLAFLAPLLLIYEAGVLWLGGHDADVIRNGADYWMRGLLQHTGLDHSLLLPGLVVGGLLVWHHFGKYPWRISGETLMGMFAESLVFAFVLIVAGQLQDYVFQCWNAPPTLAVGAAAARAITFIGAGIYEEVMFRLCLFPVCFFLLRRQGLSIRWSTVLAVLTTSLLFSFAHYIGPGGYDFTLFSFVFRAIAGLFFAVLFVVRGFGITVGCHAAYDLLVGVLLSAQA